MIMKRVLLLILLLGCLFRFYNLNWDANFHLHPDERFLTMVGNSLKVPANILNYLDPAKSTFNPANTGYKFFVYGTFPLTLNKILAVFFHNDDYNNFTLQGRLLSAFFDLMTVIMVYKIAGLLIQKNSKFKFQASSIQLLSAFFYAVAVYPIQSSHFFTVDSFQVFFSLASVNFFLKYLYQSNKRNIISLILSSIFFGLSIASKISAVFLLPLILFLLLIHLRKNIKRLIFLSSGYLLFAAVVLRLADPKFFTAEFINNIKQLSSYSNPDVWYPPMVQWLNKVPVAFSLTNLAVFGVGLPYFILIVIGVIYIIKNWRITNYALRIILIWVILFFLYQSSQLVQSIRYLYILFPFLAIFAGIGMCQLINYGLHITDSKLIRNASFVIVLIVLLIWPVMFFSIYLQPQSRVSASKWIYENLPNQSIILSESWDDPLPLGVNNNGKTFYIEQLPVFDPDTTEKWQKMNKLLSKADYYILSSNRGWGSITTVPSKYPRMSRFYQNLFAGKTNYKRIKEFTVYPGITILGKHLTLNDSWSEEMFTVYDHPQVMIFARKKK